MRYNDESLAEKVQKIKEELYLDAQKVQMLEELKKMNILRINGLYEIMKRNITSIRRDMIQLRILQLGG